MPGLDDSIDREKGAAATRMVGEVDGELVVSASEVLYEGMPSNAHSCCRVGAKASHWS